MIGLILLILGGVIAALLLLALVGWLLWRRLSSDQRQLMKRISRLPVGRKLWLGRRLIGDRRIPLGVRLIPPALILYLAMPLDLIPDFIPVLGQLDDLLVIAIAAGLLIVLVPQGALRDAVERAEREPGRVEELPDERSK